MSGKDLQDIFGVLVIHFDTSNVDIRSAKIIALPRSTGPRGKFSSQVSVYAPEPVQPKLGYNGKYPPYNLRAIHRAPLVDDSR
jgi:hypothetical protein